MGVCGMCEQGCALKQTEKRSWGQARKENISKAEHSLFLRRPASPSPFPRLAFRESPLEPY